MISKTNEECSSFLCVKFFTEELCILEIQLVERNPESGFSSSSRLSRHVQIHCFPAFSRKIQRALPIALNAMISQKRLVGHVSFLSDFIGLFSDVSGFILRLHALEDYATIIL
ncbi:hypothetical protein DWY25_16640 [Holdemania filiformis]|uniref:Uncharacterized protein n=1 Tax=Holdemania filiformis TaxID=61171 RepID=A0A412FI68_9FIRM|nr:hypothetical protein DWY25_16640 [Holdemania filiformis]